VGVTEIPVGQALAPSLLAGYDWALNPYRGCAFDCLYCYAPDVVRMDRSTWGETIFVKRAIPTVLARELKRKKRGVIGMSTVTDAYQPVERKLEVTRRCLEVIARAGWPVSVLTKSPLVARDIDLLQKIEGAEVGFSIATGDDAERRRWEPSCPPIQARFDALRQVAKEGVRAYVFAGPLLPDGDPGAMRALAKAAAAAGAAEVMADLMHPRPGPLAAIIDATSLLGAPRRESRARALLEALEAACNDEGVRFTRAMNFEPRDSNGGGRHEHLVPARAAKQDAPVLGDAREIRGAAAALADPLAVDLGAYEFD
jgi:DNA repair photolyase